LSYLFAGSSALFGLLGFLGFSCLLAGLLGSLLGLHESALLVASETLSCLSLGDSSASERKLTLGRLDDTSSDQTNKNLVQNKTGNLDALLGESPLDSSSGDASLHTLHNGNNALGDGSAASSALVGGASGTSSLSLGHLLLGLFGLLGGLLGLSSRLSALLGGLATLSALLGGLSALAGLLGLLGGLALSPLAGVWLRGDNLLLGGLLLDGDNLLERHGCYCQFSVWLWKLLVWSRQDSYRISPCTLR